MEELIKQRKGAAKYFVDLARYPDPFDQEERNILSTLVAQKYQQHIHVPFLITDHSSMEFLFVSKNVKRYLGYSDKDILREGVDITFALIHPDDVSRTLEIHKNLFDLYFAVPVAERLTYKYCNEVRFKSPDGKYIWWLHEVTFLKTDGDGRPVISLSTLTDITALKRDDTLNLYVGRYEDGINYAVKIAKKYPLLRDVAKLSRREIEILKLISDGYVSKQIADKLHISFNTVNTHRQHMLEKTNTLTTSELVSYAMERELL